MYFFRLTEFNIGFAALLNEGIRPSVLDEDGSTQNFVVYEDERTNEIISDPVPRNVQLTGTKISFEVPK